MKKLLLTGFSTFSDHKENSSQIMAERFRGMSFYNLEINSVVLPVTFANSFEILKKEMDAYKPDYVICMGLAGNRKRIDLEKVAINLIHCKKPDNEGVLYQDTLIDPNGPTAYFSTLPIEKMRECATDFPIRMSFSAGTYVCNFLMYKVLSEVQGKNISAGFIHLPHLLDNEEDIFSSLKKMFQVL